MSTLTIQSDTTHALDHTLLFVIHGAIRTDLDRLRVAVAELSPGDRKQARRLGVWFAQFGAAVEVHHHTEDEILFPALRRRAGGTFYQACRLDEDHHRLDELLHAITARLNTLAIGSDEGSAVRARLVDDVDELRSLMQSHLDVEESQVVPLLDEWFDDESYAELGEQAARLHKPRQVLFMVPWIVAHADADTADRLRVEARLAMRIVERLGRRRFRTLDAALPPQVGGD